MSGCAQPSVRSINHLRLAGLAPAFGGDRPLRFGNAGRSGGWHVVGRAARRSDASVAHAGRARSAPSGGWFGSWRFSGGGAPAAWRLLCTAAARRWCGSARCRQAARWANLGCRMVAVARVGGRRRVFTPVGGRYGPPAWRMSTAGRGQPAGAGGRHPPNKALQVDRLNRADFTRPGAVNVGSIQRGRLLQPAPERHR
jgi:hypothetical protein